MAFNGFILAKSHLVIPAPPALQVIPEIPALQALPALWAPQVLLLASQAPREAQAPRDILALRVVLEIPALLARQAQFQLHLAPQVASARQAPQAPREIRAPAAPAALPEAAAPRVAPALLALLELVSNIKALLRQPEAFRLAAIFRVMRISFRQMITFGFGTVPHGLMAAL